ncbi:flavin reductase family protein [Streptomyces luteolus]|uniref:Flavin reductase family protein n=1 Tax=Streptomyces luteolus TaxID=3043615 RepID=A0ABT6T5C2_9ACTN|nr:flavin reductase family protein [Streptomyces sp. B-S-A12]MDI3422620.1 flavin reductase family protein [Streptomyces sp. B-S-A12]
MTPQPGVDCGPAPGARAGAGQDGAAEGGLDPALFRGAMARFPTGVALVTTHDQDGGPHGFTASSLCSVSLHPPMLLVCLATSARCFRVFAQSPRFAVSVLREGPEHAELARRFAGKGLDKFAGGGFVTTPRGGTVLAGALAVVECAVRRRVDAGDHVVLLGEAEHVTLPGHSGRPAVYVDRGFGALCGSGCAGTG